MSSGPRRHRSVLGTLLISFPLGFLAKGQPHVCFTRPEDFAHENLRGGHWNITATAASFEAFAPNRTRWVDRGLEHVVRDARNVSFGDLRCPLEEYVHACGSGLGTERAFNYTVAGTGLKDWKYAEKNWPRWRRRWLETGEHAWRRRRYELPNCTFPVVDGDALVEALRGRRLLIRGDSIMRQIFITLSCLLPTRLVATYNPLWEKGEAAARFRLAPGSNVKLRGGGSIEWWPGKRANAKKEILVEQNDLHHNNKKPLEDLLYNLYPTTDSEAGRARYYEQLPLYPWRLLVERSIQHFGNHRGSEGAACAHAVDGHYEKTSATIGHKCLRCVPASSRHSLESLLAGRLAMIPSEMLRSAGQSHPDTFYTDCTHYCQPGPQDALAATLSQIIVEYRTATTFFERVTNSTYWRQAHEAQRLLYRPNETLRLPSCPSCD